MTGRRPWPEAIVAQKREGPVRATAGGLAARLAARVRRRARSDSRVARALVGAGTLVELGERALSRCATRSPSTSPRSTCPTVERHALRRYVVSRAPRRRRSAARRAVASTRTRWRLTVAAGSPLVFHAPGSWLVENPFEPPARPGSCSRSWPARSLGVVAAGPRRPVRSTPLGATRARAARGPLCAGVATARLRQELAARRGRARARAARGRGARRPRAGPRARHAGARAARLATSRRAAASEPRPPPGSGRLRAPHGARTPRGPDRAAPAGRARAGGRGGCARAAARGLHVRAQPGPGRLDVPPDRRPRWLCACSPRHSPTPRATRRQRAGRAERDGRRAPHRARRRPRLRPGRGPGAGEGHFGLAIMRQRATEAGGELTLTSAPGAGTEILLRLPPVA